MAGRCPQCYAELPEDRVWLCPACGYTLKTPALSKAGILFMFLGLLLLGAYVLGPDAIGLRSGVIPTDLANLMIAYFPELVLGTFTLGMILAAAGALKIRGERARGSGV